MLAACTANPAPTVDASGLPVNRAVTRSELIARPEARLFYPGSMLVSKVGADQTPTSPGQEPNPAYSGAILTSSARPAQLYAWYGTWLKAHGYLPATDYRPASQVSGQAWQAHHRLQVQVGVFDPKLLKADQGVSAMAPPGGVVYEEVLVGYPPGLPKS